MSVTGSLLMRVTLRFAGDGWASITGRPGAARHGTRRVAKATYQKGERANTSQTLFFSFSLLRLALPRHSLSYCTFFINR